MDHLTKSESENLKQRVISRHFAALNPMQRQAVCRTKGPVLILAGAGSGKTTVLVNRVANLILFGTAADAPAGEYSLDEAAVLEDFAQGRAREPKTLLQVADIIATERPKPWNILAITFTNKAAGELKERLVKMLGEAGDEVHAATFHSACVRMLRADISRLGYTSSFTIYDGDDQIRLIKNALSARNIDDKVLPARAALSMISAAKDAGLDPAAMEAQAGDNYRQQLCAKVYAYYQNALKAANAVDFDDIIILTVKLLEQFPDVLEKYQRRYRYIMVDEYQDTNNTQYRLVSLLAAGHKNLCVVGDDDQSIYKFRGATIENILSFERQFPGALVIRLEQNYRSTGSILEAANALIANNTQRKGKTLWTQNEQGEKITLFRGRDEQGETSFIADKIAANVKEGARYADHAVLYRMNAQSNTLEQGFIRWGIPYRIVGGVRFYERKEIKDMMAYLSVLENPADHLRLCRIINEPKRGIGDATVAAASSIANLLNLSLFEVIANAGDYPAIAKKSGLLTSFAAMIQSLRDNLDTRPLDETFQLLLEESGYLNALQAQGFEGQTRVENIEELGSNILKYMEESEEPTLAGFLEEVALITDIDRYDPNADAVVMMTLHAAKGLEFPYVFIAGMEDGIFPGMQSIYNPAEMEEERRLAYVGVTRAKKVLTITCAAERMLFGQTNRNRPSRFAKEIPPLLVESIDEVVPKRSAYSGQAETTVASAAAASARKISGFGQSQSAPAEQLSVGDMVSHRVFGTGLVTAITPMGGDSLVEVAFEKVGTKKIMSNFAKLKKL